MQCAEFEDRLNRLLDHRLPPEDDGPLAEHARGCHACADVLVAQRRLFAGLRALPLSPPVDLAEQVVARRHIELQSRRAAWRNLGWTVLLASAACLAGFALWSLGDRVPGDKVAVPPAAPAPRQPAAANGLALPMVRPASSRQVGPQTEQRIREYRTALETFATRIGDSKEFDEVSETLQPSIQPIQSSFGLAIDALRRTLPGGKESPPPKPDSGAYLARDGQVLA